VQVEVAISAQFFGKSIWRLDAIPLCNPIHWIPRRTRALFSLRRSSLARINTILRPRQSWPHTREKKAEHFICTDAHQILWNTVVHTRKAPASTVENSDFLHAHTKTYQEISRSLLGAHGKMYVTTPTLAAPALPQPCRAPRILISRLQRLYIDNAVRRRDVVFWAYDYFDYSSRLVNLSRAATTLSITSRLHLRLVDFSNNSHGFSTNRHGFVVTRPRIKLSHLLQ
jgi:hypothetical protein